MTMLHLYRFLLRLYPARLVEEFGEEMAAVLYELHRGSRTDVFAARCSSSQPPPHASRYYTQRVTTPRGS